jgi:hypothetical protein
LLLLNVWNEELSWRLLSQIRIESISTDPNDLNLIRSKLPAMAVCIMSANGESSAEWILPWKSSFRQLLIDDPYFGRGRSILWSE